MVDVERVFLSHNILGINLSNLRTNNLIKAASAKKQQDLPKSFSRFIKTFQKDIRILLVEESKSHEYADIPY